MRPAAAVQDNTKNAVWLCCSMIAIVKTVNEIQRPLRIKAVVCPFEALKTAQALMPKKTKSQICQVSVSIKGIPKIKNKGAARQ